MAGIKGPGKITVACPHCHAKQTESPFAKSTFCRTCGKHVDLRKTKAAPAPFEAPAEGRGIFQKFSRLINREKFREIHCFACDTAQTVSSFAESGSCVHCGIYMDLRDVNVAGHFNRSVQTHGALEVGKKGDVTSSKIVCGSGMIYGKVQGNLQCTGTMRIKTEGRMVGAIEAKILVVEKRSDVEFVRPLRVTSAQIEGKASARIYADSVTIASSGELEGSVHAKSIKIEKGGVFSGDLFIGSQEMEQPELLPAKSKVPKKKPVDDFGDQPSLALA